MDLLLIAAVIILYSFQTLFCKLFTDKYPGRAELASPVFGVLEGLFIALFTFAFNGFQFTASPFTIIMGVLNAAMLFGYNTSLIAASKKGSYAFMNVILLFGGILIPSVYSWTFLSEEITALKIIGILAMLVALVLMNLSEMKMEKSPLIYYVFCFILFIFNGAYSTIVKVQTVYHDDEKQEMIMLTFLIMSFVALFELIAKEKKNTLKAFKLNVKSIIPLAVCLISAGRAINLLVFIIPFVDTAVLYTIESGGVLVLSALYSVILFKEKLSPSKFIGIILAVASITVLSI